MKATECVKTLETMIKKHGDCDVYYEYDGGIRIPCNIIRYYKKIDSNSYSEYWPKLKNVIILKSREE